jgi:hypothetical protein
MWGATPQKGNMSKSSALIALSKRKKAKSELSALFMEMGKAVAVHYSCESFYDRVDGTSPRITSIAVRKLDSAQTTSFSIHQIAEIEKIPLLEIGNCFDRLERTMLDNFYEYMRQHQHCKWVHWNMRDMNYGFPAIAHRYKVLGGVPVDIPESQLIDLARVLIAIYGPAYSGHPRLESLMKKNKISDRDFLVGKEEAEAFECHEYVKLHQSTLRKVDIIGNILSRVENGTLKTNRKVIDPLLLYPRAAMELAKEHWLFSIALPVLAIIIKLSDIAGFVSRLSAK